MSRRWQRALRVFPLSTEFNVPYVRCARGELLSLDVVAVYAALSEPRRLEPVAYWRARLDAALERALRTTFKGYEAEDVCRRRLATARAVVAYVAGAFAADRVRLSELDLLAPTRRPLGGASWTRAQRNPKTPENEQAPSHQEVHSCRFT